MPGHKRNKKVQWKRVASACVLIIRHKRKPEILIAKDFPKGSFERPPFVEMAPGAKPAKEAERCVKLLGMRAGTTMLKDLRLKLVFYQQEERHDEHLFSIEVPAGTLAPEGYRWASPSGAMRSFLLSGHKRGLIRLFPELMPGGMLALDHVLVDHPSGYVFICDFDGTVTQTEASLAILRRFIPGQWERYERPWLEQEISTHDCLGYQFTMLDTSIEEMARFAARSIKLRSGFKDFVRWCKRKGHGLVISSSGVEFYIKAILDKNGLGDVAILADRNHWIDGLGHIAEEGLFNQECDWCGNCKSNLVEHYRASGAKVVFVGDGKTDECPCKRADFVFARSTLLRSCKQRHVQDFFPFETFDDVRACFEARIECR